MPCAIKTEIHTLRWSTAARLAHLVAAAQELLGEQFWGWLVTDR